MSINLYETEQPSVKRIDERQNSSTKLLIFNFTFESILDKLEFRPNGWINFQYLVNRSIAKRSNGTEHIK